MLRPRMTSWGGGLGRVPLALTGQSVRHDESSMVVKQKNYYGADGEKAYISRKS